MDKRDFWAVFLGSMAGTIAGIAAALVYLHIV